MNFKGNTEEAFTFYKSVFGGEFATVMRFGEMPGCDEAQVSDSDKEKIMHIALPISDGHILMGTDAVGEYADKSIYGNNISISVSVDSKEEAENVFNGLSEGGEITMPLDDTFWGAYFGMLKDKFGIHWLINYDYPRENI